MVVKNNKSLGQHWLTDRNILAAIADEAHITENDTVLEIGPGLGTLTSELLRRAKNVIAVEFDRRLAANLPAQFPGTKLEVYNEDILSFDLSKLPEGYKVVANIPYYITNKIISMLVNAHNKPSEIVLLIQKEVAERLVAKPGEMSILALSAQIYADVRLGVEVGKSYFTPPPKVDSQVVVLSTRKAPLVEAENESIFFRLVKAGFSSKRKKLRSSISAGLGMSKLQAESLLHDAKIDPNDRAESLSIDQWNNLVRVYKDS